jgi:acyl-CoA oxidase
MADVIGVCRERCGAQGMFSVNRIADYVSLLQGLVTAEGDNQVLLATVAGQLLVQPDGGPEPTVPRPRDSRPEAPALQLDLLRYRERCLRLTARESMADESRWDTYFTAWNGNVSGALAMARVRGARLALERFLAAVEDAETESARASLRPLAALYALTEIQRDSGWYLAHGALTADQVEGLPAAIDSLCERIRPHVAMLIEGFSLSPELLRAPIAADDYVTAFDRRTGASRG